MFILEKEADLIHAVKRCLCFGKKKEICREMSKKYNIHLKSNETETRVISYN
ncbi:hypothetical protein B4110_0372 [Parageobacillus toebii]|uniref:Uncharacterized protein n=1 Tax=Parageobacillus toebii TaxID=153151 RepID=A0A150MBB5_9BACL|nr:hypothetical protein B4110_0372 [Parageobacillus toebii]